MLGLRTNESETWRKKPLTRAAANGVDLRAAKNHAKWFSTVAKTKVAALEALASDVDASFEARCEDYRAAITAFDQACADFIEYQSEDLVDE